MRFLGGGGRLQTETVADLRGGQERRVPPPPPGLQSSPPRLQILSFSCSFRQNFCKIIGWHTLIWSWRPSGKSWIPHWELQLIEVMNFTKNTGVVWRRSVILSVKRLYIIVRFNLTKPIRNPIPRKTVIYVAHWHASDNAFMSQSMRINTRSCLRACASTRVQQCVPVSEHAHQHAFLW